MEVRAVCLRCKSFLVAKDGMSQVSDGPQQSN